MPDWIKIFHFNKALQKGHFKLSSGLHSPVYIQCARVLMFPWYAEELGRILADAIRSIAVPEYIVSPALGGVIIGHETARALGVPFVFTERYSGTMTLRRGFHFPRGARFWVIEDVVTTGKSSLETAEVIEQHGGKIAGYGAIVDRRQGDKNGFEPFVYVIKVDAPNYEPESCPLCQQHIPLVSPGSRHQFQLGKDS